MSTIMLMVSKSVYFNVKGDIISYGVWKKLCNLHEKQCAVRQVYSLKKLFDLHMKEGMLVFAHLNEFNTIFSQLAD